VFGEALAFRQLVDAQPFVEQKVEIAPRQQGGLHTSIFADTAGQIAKVADPPICPQFRGRADRRTVRLVRT
jgi:hypothetical protein